MFSCKRIGLAEVWEKGKSKGSKGRGGKSQRSQGLGGQRARVRVLCSEDLVEGSRWCQLGVGVV